MPINPGSIYPNFEKFCGIGKKMPNQKLITNTVELAGIPKAKDKPILSPDTLTDYFLSATQCYDGHQVNQRISNLPSEMTMAIWNVIAFNIAKHFHDSRNGPGPTDGCTPRDVPGGAAFSGGPVGGVLASPGFPAQLAPGFLKDGNGGRPGRAKASIEAKKMEAIQAAVYKWLARNYESAIEEGKKKNATAQTLSEISGLPKNKDEVVAVEKAFNTYFNGAEFSAKPGLPLPPALVPKDKTMEYFPDMAPHKDTDENSGPDIAGVKKGSAGFCMGPFYRVVTLESDGNGNKCKVKNGATDQKSPKFKTMQAPIDDQEFFVDDEAGNKESGRLRQFLGEPAYSTFVKGRSKTFPDGPSGLPVNGGKEITVDYIDADDKTQTIFTGVKGLPTNGLFETLGAAANNTNYNNVMTEDQKIAMGYGQPSLDTGVTIKDWVTNAAGNNVLGKIDGESKNMIWSGNRNQGAAKYNKGQLEQPVESYMSIARIASTAAAPDTGETGLSNSDPRTWGPWLEYADESDKTRRFKHLVPNASALASAILAGTDATQNDVPGVALNGAPCLPQLNKAYWGFRLREVFNDETKGDPASQAISAGNSAMPYSAGIIVKNVIGIAGPVPPLKITANNDTGKFEWKNQHVLVKLKSNPRTVGHEFTRRDNNNTANHDYYHTIATHFMDTKDGVASKVDKLATGNAKGGMTYVDVTKQILFPYTPPPLKPFMPNSEEFKW